MRAAAAVLCLVGFAPRPALAQRQFANGDSLRLGTLQDAALRTDPRRRELELQADQTALRLRSIAAERLPSFSGQAVAQYQSDVVRIPFRFPDGVGVSSPARDTYDARLNAQQPIFDPSLGPRRAAEEAQLAEAQAAVRTTLHGGRIEVNESFFTAIALQASLDDIDAALAGLEARAREAAARVRAGASLPSDTAALEAVILERRQDEAGLRARRHAALARLSDLTGRNIVAGDVLVLPDLRAETESARAALDGLRTRPEYERFARARDRLARQADVASARERPRLSAFGRVGYGRPGLNLLSDRFDSYWVAGVELQWTPWTWGSVRREREALALQRQIVAADEQAFERALRRFVEGDLAALDRLATTLAADERIVVLREQIERETRARFREGVVTGAEYADRHTELLQARLARSAHRVELSETRARLLTTLGLEVR